MPVQTVFGATVQCDQKSNMLGENFGRDRGWRAVIEHTLFFNDICYGSRGGVAAEPWHLSFKETADTFEKARNLQGLTAAIEQSDIEGKSCILSQLPTLYSRYVLNNGVSPTETV